MISAASSAGRQAGAVLLRLAIATAASIAAALLAYGGILLLLWIAA